MIGKIIEINRVNARIKLEVNDELKKNLTNFHVAFDTDNTVIIGEVISVDNDTALINLIGEISNNAFVPGISKKPYYGAVCRLITNNELPIIVGNTNEKSIYMGRLMKYNGYQVFTKVNDLFSNHFAIMGNTGSGKSCSTARMLQNLFFVENYPKKSNIFLFDAYGEYNNAFKVSGRDILKVYTTQISEFPDANTELLKLPLWLLDVDDYALLLGATKTNQIPIIEKALKLVSIFSRDGEDINKIKNNIIAKAIVELLYSGGTPSQIRDQIFAVLTTFSTNELSLDSKVVVPGWTRTLRQCLIIDKDGKLPEMQLIAEYFNSFIIDNLELSLPDGTFAYTLADLNQAFDFALISEGILKSDKVYDDNHVLKVRLETLLNGPQKEMFSVDTFVNKEQYLRNLVNKKDGTKAQIIDFNISYVDDRFAKVLVKILSKFVFEYALTLKDRATFPVHILLEEAHRYVQNDTDREVIGYNIFDRITKEGRKYGVILGLISQRPSEISETAISQCTNFFIFRMQHPKDLEYIKEMVPNVTDEIVSKFKVLQPGNCMAFGSAFKLPLELKFDMPNPQPLSQSLDVTKSWYE